MSIIVAPLGDSHFIDIGWRSPNNFGVDIDFLSDIWGGVAAATIPNPRGPLIQRYELTEYDCSPPSSVPEPAYALLIAMIAIVVICVRWRGLKA